MLQQASKSLKRIHHVLNQSSTPLSRNHLPGFLRAFAADAATITNPETPHESTSAADAIMPHDTDTAKQAYAQLVQTIFGQAVQAAQLAPHTSAFEGLQFLEEQEQRATSETGERNEPAHLTRSLAALRYHQRMMDGTPRGRKLQQNWQRQIILETRAVDAAMARYKREAEAAVRRGAGATLPAARKLLVGWFHPLADAIRAEQYRIAKGTPGMDRSVYGPYLLRLDPEQLAVIAMHAAINAFMSPDPDAEAVGSAPGTCRMTKLATSLGRAVEAQHHVNQLEALAHEQNMKRKEVRELYARGKALRMLLEGDTHSNTNNNTNNSNNNNNNSNIHSSGALSEEQWREWFDIGHKLRAHGEMLPIDHMEWFMDESFEARLKAIAQQFKLPEANSEQEMNMIILRARRLLSDSSRDVEWLQEMQAKVGVVLIKLMIDACKIDVYRDGAVQTVPAFWHKLEQGPDMKRASRGMWKRYGLLYADEEVMRRIKPHHMAEAFMPQFLPMVVPPVPWQRHNLGGHLTLRSPVMRMRGSHMQKQRLEKADAAMVEGRGDGLSKVYDALDALGNTAWSINNDVYNVVEAVWAWGGGICDIPRRDNVEVPPLLSMNYRMHYTPGGNLSFFSHPKSDVKNRMYLASRAKKRNNELHSLRCDMEYKLAIAREFANEERFYFPHNVDFRGRAYPMHPHLNHLGSDLCRGLLQFADARPLGQSGLRWLYIQAANLWGHSVDKLALEGRVRWVEDNLGAILANATDPFRRPPSWNNNSNSSSSGGGSNSGSNNNTLMRGGDSITTHANNITNNNDTTDDDSYHLNNDGHAVLQALLSETGDTSTPYWYRAEAPFQFLAVCFDIYRALASGDPSSYRSKLPVHQDGSCNGLQHYAALGRDLTGGWAVNLCPVERPQDVYSEIARLVEKRVHADAAAGVPEAESLLASTTIDRKLVKQTVMTSVYGVTFVGARAQIGNRLRERGFEDNHAMYKVSCYSARVTLDCLHEMFQSAKHIMQWLSECARVIAKNGRAVGWTTPLGLPVVQPYRRKTQQHVRTVLQRLVLATSGDDKPVMKQRQRTAFPPNYVHSIDSSHMMLTAIACRDAGLDFAGVHDSFWTHAGTVDQMNGLLREMFIQLHSQPLLETLLEELQEEHPDIDFPPLPPRGDLSLEDIRNATYFFS